MLLEFEKMQKKTKQELQEMEKPCILPVRKKGMKGERTRSLKITRGSLYTIMTGPFIIMERIIRNALHQKIYLTECPGYLDKENRWL